MCSRLFSSAARQCLFVFVMLLVIGGCTQNQDDIKLPIYDSLGGNFTLPSTTDADVTLSDYQGKIVLLNFGYTHCPDICPMVLNRVANLSKKLELQFGIDSHKLQTIFITVDPERDTLLLLKEYLAFFNENFIGISGSEKQTAEVANSYAVFFEKEVIENGDYQVAHNDKIFLLDKRGRLRALYSKSDTDEDIINAIVSLSAAKI